jgi:type I restriction enzyme S subunit
MMDGKPYPIPQTWAESSIGKVVVKTKQQDPRKKPCEVFQYVDVSAVSNASFKITGTTTTLGSEAPSRARKAIQTDDVLFATVRPTLKRIALVPSELDGAIASTGYCVLRCDKAKASPGFLYSFLISDHFTARMAGLERGASYPAVRDSDVTASWLPLPPLPEQKKIAHILSTVQRAIEAQERIIATTTELKKALMQKLFTEGLRHEPQKQTEIGPVPESWEVVELGSIAKVGNGSTPKRANEAYWESGTIPWLNSTKIHDRFITEADQFVTPQAVKECHLPTVAPNSLLIAITGQGKTLGNSAITRIETCINQHLAYAQFHAAKILPDFVLWFMQTRYDYLRAIAHGGGSTKGALTCGFLKTLPIPVPTRAEQEKIAATFQTLEDKQAFAARKEATLKDLFRTLLHELMTAKTRVHELEFASGGRAA